MAGKYLSPKLFAAPQRAPPVVLPRSGATHKWTAKMVVLSVCVGALDKDSQQSYDYDQTKARKALNELDEQLHLLVQMPKIRESNLPDTLRDQMKEEEAELSGPALPYGAFALFAFTILYNVFFLTVIKPSIDVPDDVAETLTPLREAPGFEMLQMLLSHPLASNILVAEL